MSLKIITDKTTVEEMKIKYVDYNDLFFQSMTLIDNEITTKILQIIDKARYANQDSFIGRDEVLGAMNKSLLSSGCKTLLNIAYNPNICFSVAECGPNALETLSIINDGIIYWENPALFLVEDVACNIEYNNKQYTKFMDFLSDAMN